MATWRGHRLPLQEQCPDPLLSGKELPTFKFALEKSEGKVIGGSFGKEATVEQLPISKGIAGVSMRLEPGVTRELHWHATAAEWAFVLEGRVRTTVIDPHGYAETNDFDPGDVWYFPRGHGHMLECLGNEPCHFILIFDNGYFSEFGTFSITDWLGHAPKELLAKNFGLPESTFDGFPTEEVYFVRGPMPPESHRRSGWLNSPPRDPQVSVARSGAAFDPQIRTRMAGRRQPLSRSQDHDRRDSRPRAGRTARTALASQLPTSGNTSSTANSVSAVRLARPLPDRDAWPRVTWLYPSGLWPFDREYRRQGRPRVDRSEYRELPGDRSFPVDRQQSVLSARGSFRQAAGGFR